MPFVPNMPDDEEQQKAPSQGAVPASGGSPMQLSPSSGVVGAGGANGQKPSATPAGGQFASLNDYLKANVGQAEPLAGKITSDVGKQYQNLSEQGNQTIAGINQAVAGQAPAANSQDILAQEAANPASFASTPGNVASFQNLLNATYSGPASAEGTSGYAKQQADINSAISKGQAAVTSEAGRENLLSGSERRPTQSVTALNSAILSKSPTALASVEGAYKPFQGLLSDLSSGAAATNKAIADQQANIASTRSAATNALTSQMGGLNTTVGNEVTAAQQRLADQNAAIKADLASGNPSDATLGTLGMTRDQWNSLSAAQKAAATSQDVFSNKGQYGAKSGATNIDLSNFLSQTAPQDVVTAANAATPEDYARAKAFQTLVGNLNLGAPTMAINPNAAAQAGTAPTNLNNFDYSTALNTATQAKADQIAAAQAYVDALQSGADETHAQLAAQAAAKKSQATMLAALGQTPLAATAAAASGIAGAGKNVYDQFSSGPSAVKNIAANILTGGLATPVQAVSKGVQQAVSTVTNIFCFHPDTFIEMASGSLLPIHKVAVGDITRGGRVLATTRAIGQDFYWYNGVIVTGKHAVRENGTWVRVENSKMGHRFKYLTEVVCNLVTERHRIYANGIEFADQYETDLYESLSMDESLRELNRNADHLG